MLARISPARHRLAERDGLVALEFLAVVGAWLACLAFLLDMCLVLGNGVVMQSVLNRAALQATAEGCVSPQSQTSIGDLTGLLARNITLDAVWSGKSTYSASHPVHTFDRTQALNQVSGGDTSGLCSTSVNLGGGDVVPQGQYIFLELDYDQHLLLFPNLHVRKTALAVSSSLNLESNGG